jgi:MSHA biogenesis protein MshQ
VGLLNLDVQDSNYGNVGITIPAEAINIGRFIPAYFIQTVKSDGILNAKHTLAGDCSIKNWAYSGQKTDNKGTVTYNLMPPEILITAFNANDRITKNYTVSGYMKLELDDIDVGEPIADFEKNRIDPDVPGEKVKISSEMTRGLSINVEEPGVLNYSFNAEDNFTYEHNAHSLYEPFPAKIPFTTTRIEDGDSVMLYDGTDPAISATEDVLSEGIEIRFGRLVLENSFGPETSNLPQPMQIQYFDGTNFIVNSDEGCATYDASNISLNKITDGLDLADTDAIGGTGDFLTGETRTIELSAPGAGNTGEVGVVYSTFEWLKFDWENTGSYDQNPSAIATFGLYRGNDRIISWREVNNE